MMTIEQEVWLRAWCATASATNTYDKDRTDQWADHCLRSFQSRFPVPAPPIPPPCIPDPRVREILEYLDGGHHPPTEDTKGL